METMKAARIHAFGGPEVLELDELAVPSVGERDVLIRICAAGINPVDYKMRSGAFPVPKEQLPKVLGREVAGTIDQCGERVTTWRVGDEVYALLDPAHGGYAQYVALSADLCARKPSNLSFIEAAGVPLAGLTAWQGLFDYGKLAAGQTVLIHGGAGGVGHLAIQFAKAKNARVITTVARGDVDFARGLGADQIVIYDYERFEEHVKDVDLVFDLVGGDTRDRSFAVLKHGGTLVSTLGKPDESKARERGIRVEGYMAQPNATQLGEITDLIEAGKVQPRIQATFALEDARSALGQLERKHSRGKVVLEMRA